MKKKPLILVALLVLLILIQFFRINKINPPVKASVDFQTLVNISPERLAILKEACYDCHSNETRFPWYAEIAPFSWRMFNHVKEGRRHLNFSEWGTFTAKKKSDRIEDIEDALSNGWMPLWDYKMMHSKANITSAQRADLAAWVKTLK